MSWIHRVPLSLSWGSSTLANFGTVALQQEPQWSREGGWNVPTSMVTQAVAFGAVLPYESVTALRKRSIRSARVRAASSRALRNQLNECFTGTMESYRKGRYQE